MALKRVYNLSSVKQRWPLARNDAKGMETGVDVGTRQGLVLRLERQCAE